MFVQKCTAFFTNESNIQAQFMYNRKVFRVFCELVELTTCIQAAGFVIDVKWQLWFTVPIKALLKMSQFNSISFSKLWTKFNLLKTSSTQIATVIIAFQPRFGRLGSGEPYLYSKHLAQ